MGEASQPYDDQVMTSNGAMPAAASYSSMLHRKFDPEQYLGTCLRTGLRILRPTRIDTCDDVGAFLGTHR